MKLKFMCDGCRSVIRNRDDGFDAGEYFAGVIARREYGLRGHVGPCRLDSWTEDGRIGEYDAFIGVSNGNGMVGHNVHFTVTTELIEK